MAGHAIIAGLDLWQATGDRTYADQAIAPSKSITDSQQRSFLPGLTIPLTGFFYTAPDKSRILRYQHLSHEEAPTDRKSTRLNSSHANISYVGLCLKKKK